MKLKFFNPEHLDKNLKATVHRTGKLGFTVEAAKKLKLSVEKSAGIAMNEEDVNDMNLYVIIYLNRTKGSFNINKAGNYFYINTKALFDNLKIDYIKEPVIYDILEENIEGQNMFKFKRRGKLKKEEVIENRIKT